MIKQKPNGKWWLNIKDENGDKIRLTFDKKADAEAKERQILQRKYDAKLEKAELKKKRFSFDKSLKDYEASKVKLRPGTQKRYKSVLLQLRYFAEGLGIKYMDEFTSDHGTQLFNELIKSRVDPKGNTDKMYTANPKTVNMYIQVIKAFFREEQIKGHIKNNPVIHLKNLRADKKAPEYYTGEELKKFFSQSMAEPYRNFFFGLLQTGMRFAELANLKWTDVDFSKKLLHVRSTDTFMTKTAQSARSIPLTSDLMKILKKLEKDKKSDLVFTTQSGTQIKERRALTICKKVAAKAGIKSNAFLHKFRHTYATILVQKGERLEDIKELLGHSSVIETEIYAHNKADHMHDKVTHLDNLIKFDEEAGQ